MPYVHVKLYEPNQNGASAINEGYIEFKPTARFDSSFVPDAEMLPAPFDVTLDTDGEADVFMEATSPNWAWRVTEYIEGGQRYYVEVPSTGTNFELKDLTRVNPETLEPEAQFPAWQTLTDRVDNAEVNIANLELAIENIPAAPAAVRYTPVLTATGMTYTGTGATAPAYESHYVKNGQLVTFNIKVNLSTVTNFGTGQIKLNDALPYAPLTTAANHFSAWSWVNPALPPDDLNGHIQMVADHLPNSTTLDLHWLTAATSNPKPVIETIFEQGIPSTLTTSSVIYLNGTYISAS